jgi:hypothetical protein
MNQNQRNFVIIFRENFNPQGAPLSSVYQQAGLIRGVIKRLQDNIYSRTFDALHIRKKQRLQDSGIMIFKLLKPQ